MQSGRAVTIPAQSADDLRPRHIFGRRAARRDVIDRRFSARHLRRSSAGGHDLRRRSHEVLPGRLDRGGSWPCLYDRQAPILQSPLSGHLRQGRPRPSSARPRRTAPEPRLIRAARREVERPLPLWIGSGLVVAPPNLFSEQRRETHPGDQGHTRGGGDFVLSRCRGHVAATSSSRAAEAT